MGNRRYAYTRAAKTLVPNHVASKNALNKIDGLIDLSRSLILIDLSRVESVDAVENLCCAEAQNRLHDFGEGKSTGEGAHEFVACSALIRKKSKNAIIRACLEQRAIRAKVRTGANLLALPLLETHR